MLVRFQNRSKFRPIAGRRFKRLKIKITLLPETDNKNSFSPLRHPRFRTDYPMMNLVTEFLFKDFEDCCEGAPLIMAFKVLHILKDKSGWALLARALSS